MLSFSEQKASYIELLNGYLDAIELKSTEQAPGILSAMRQELSIMHKDFILGSTTEQSTIIVLHELYDLFINPESYVMADNIQHFKALIIQRINKFLKNLENLTLYELKNVIENKSALKQKNQEDVSKTKSEIEGALNKRIDTSLTAEELQAMRDLQIDLKTRKPEALVCIASFKIVEAITALDQRFKLAAEKMESSGMDIPANEISEMEIILDQISQGYREVLKDQLSFSLERVLAKISAEGVGIDTMSTPKFDLLNIIILFEKSFFTLEQFKALSPEIQNYLISNSDTIQKLQNCQANEFEFCAQLLINMENLHPFRSRLAKALGRSDEEQNKMQPTAIGLLNVTMGLELNPSDFTHEQMLETMKSACQLFERGSFTLDVFKTLPTAMKTFLLEQPSLVLQLIEGYGLDPICLSNCDTELLQKLSEKLELLGDFLRNSDLTINQLLPVPVNLVMNLIQDPAQLFILFKNTSFKATNLFSMTKDKLSWLFADANNLKSLQYTLNYYFIDKDVVSQLSLKDLKALCLNQDKTEQFFNKNTKAFANDELLACLQTELTTMELCAQQLNFGGFLINLEKLKDAAKQLVLNLQKLGLNFAQCRTMYELLLELNCSFAKGYIAKFKGDSQTKVLDFDQNLIRAQFGTEDADMINSLVENYAVKLMFTQAENSRKISTEDNNAKINNTKLFNSIEELNAVLAQDTPGDEALCTALENLNTDFRKMSVGITPGNFGQKQILAYKLINDNDFVTKLEALQDKSGRVNCRSETLKSLIASFNSLLGTYEAYPLDYLPATTVGADDIFASFLMSYVF
jgi:hypothetical protein